MSKHLTPEVQVGTLVTWGRGHRNREGTYTGEWRFIQNAPRYKIRRSDGERVWVRFAVVVDDGEARP